MSDDKQKEMLSGYEQLKRKNRRRLVGASGLVLVSGILLAGALYTVRRNRSRVGSRRKCSRVGGRTGSGDLGTEFFRFGAADSCL